MTNAELKGAREEWERRDWLQTRESDTGQWNLPV